MSNLEKSLSASGDRYQNIHIKIIYNTTRSRNYKPLKYQSREEWIHKEMGYGERRELDMAERGKVRWEPGFLNVNTWKTNLFS